MKRWLSKEGLSLTKLSALPKIYLLPAYVIEKLIAHEMCVDGRASIHMEAHIDIAITIIRTEACGLNNHVYNF